MSWDDPDHDVMADIEDALWEGLMTGQVNRPGLTIDWRVPSMPEDNENGVRLWCTNDGCEVKDIRVFTAAAHARCPECGATLASNNARPQRQYRTY